MLQPAQVAVEEGAEVVHSVFQHCEPVDAAAEGESLPFVGSEAAGGDHPRMDHSGAAELHEAVRAAQYPAALHHAVADVDLRRRLGEGEVAGPQAKDDVLALEKG